MYAGPFRLVTTGDTSTTLRHVATDKEVTVRNPAVRFYLDSRRNVYLKVLAGDLQRELRAFRVPLLPASARQVSHAQLTTLATAAGTPPRRPSRRAGGTPARTKAVEAQEAELAQVQVPATGKEEPSPPSRPSRPREETAPPERMEEHGVIVLASLLREALDVMINLQPALERVGAIIFKDPYESVLQLAAMHPAHIAAAAVRVPAIGRTFDISVDAFAVEPDELRAMRDAIDRLEGGERVTIRASKDPPKASLLRGDGRGLITVQWIPEFTSIATVGIVKRYEEALRENGIGAAVPVRELAELVRASLEERAPLVLYHDPKSSPDSLIAMIHGDHMHFIRSLGTVFQHTGEPAATGYDSKVLNEALSALRKYTDDLHMFFRHEYPALLKVIARDAEVLYVIAPRTVGVPSLNEVERIVEEEMGGAPPAGGGEAGSWKAVVLRMPAGLLRRLMAFLRHVREAYLHPDIPDILIVSHEGDTYIVDDDYRMFVLRYTGGGFELPMSLSLGLGKAEVSIIERMDRGEDHVTVTLFPESWRMILSAGGQSISGIFGPGLGPYGLYKSPGDVAKHYELLKSKANDSNVEIRLDRGGVRELLRKLERLHAGTVIRVQPAGEEVVVSTYEVSGKDLVLATYGGRDVTIRRPAEKLATNDARELRNVLKAVNALMEDRGEVVLGVTDREFYIVFSAGDIDGVMLL